MRFIHATSSRKRLQGVILAEALELYRNQVSRADAISRIREIAQADQDALSTIDITERVAPGSDEYKALRELFREAALNPEESGPISKLTADEARLMSMPTSEAFKSLADREPRLKELEEIAFEMPKATPPSGRDRLPMQLTKEIRSALVAIKKPFSPVEKLIISRYVFQRAGLNEFTEHKDWWPG